MITVPARNKCIFCFIDQLPPGMRDTLYFKDDDSRLSFLAGKLYDTDQYERTRIWSGLSITIWLRSIFPSRRPNPELRCKMLHNRFAGDAAGQGSKAHMRRGIQMNGQIVLCRGVNDGEELDRIDPGSVAGICRIFRVCRWCRWDLPVIGMDCIRWSRLPKKMPKKCLDLIHSWQKKTAMRNMESHFIHAGDEWYILAEQAHAGGRAYDGYLQLENGVGMMRLLIEEVQEALC